MPTTPFPLSRRLLSGLLPALLLALPLVGCAPAAGPPLGAGPAAVAPSVQEARVEDVRRMLFDLAADSMEGRGTATRGEERAGRYIAARLAEFGLEPAGDSLYFQRVPLAVGERPDGRRRLELLPSWEAYEALPEEGRTIARNVIAVIPGSDPLLRDQALIVGAHYDHLGIGPPVDGDSIYSGADDDASGVVAVLEIGRALAAGPPPRRTVVLFLATGEEVGMLGTRWYLDHPVVPLENTVAGLFVEMIARPDPLAGGPGRGWLTGYERSTMGEILAEAGVPIIPDPRPEQNFFLRSDNTPFAFRGIPAHVLSSYGLHGEYHTPQDRADLADVEHMTEVVRAAVRAARTLADGPAPQWNPGGRPEPRGPAR
jgi:hypothetical protein